MSNKLLTVLLFTLILYGLCSAVNADTINLAEYFIDNDPGEGNGIRIDIPIDGGFDGSIETVEFSVNTTELSVGYHTVYVRMRNFDGTWGVARPLTNDVYIPSPYNFEVEGTKTISAAEYFIDSDPGEGNGKPLPLITGENDIFELSSVSTLNIPAGLHNLYVRAKDSDGKWGILRQYTFEVSSPDIIAGAEYFVDSDPGNDWSKIGTSLLSLDGLFDSKLETAEGSSTTLTTGIHTIYVRMKDIYGRYSQKPVSQGVGIGVPVISNLITPVQSGNGDGKVPLSVTIADYNGSPVKVKVEYSVNDGSLWNKATIDETSLIASYGTPVVNNTTDYQIDNVPTNSGPNQLNFNWLSGSDLSGEEYPSVIIRFILDNGINPVSALISDPLSIDNKSPLVPVLIPYSPEPACDATPLLAWNAVREAVKYHIQISHGPDFTSLDTDLVNIAANYFVQSVNLTSGVIYWKVSAIDAKGNESVFSSPDSFTLNADITAPTVSITYGLSPATEGQFLIRAVFSESIQSVPLISIDQPGAVDIANVPMSGSGNMWTYMYQIHKADGSEYIDGSAVVTFTNGFDCGGNTNQPAFNNTFTIDTTAPSGTIIGAEYFIDNDPGEGAGIFITVPDDGAYNSTKESVTFEIDTTYLGIGSHTVYLRFKNSDGTWGVARPLANDIVAASPPNFSITGDLYISSAEYFIDEDPGEGNGYPVPVIDNDFDESVEDVELTDIDTSYLEAGIHTLFMRMKDSNGNWGIVRQYPFEVSAPNKITGAEYFVDNDPGNDWSKAGTALTPVDGMFNSMSETAEGSTTTLTTGQHTIYVRMKDLYGRYSTRASSHAVGVGGPAFSFKSQPQQPFGSNGDIPITVIVEDYAGGDTYQMRAEYSFDGSTWFKATIKPGSLTATQGNPVLNNSAEYQIGSSGGYIQTSSGTNQIGFIWSSAVELAGLETNVQLRVTLRDGTVIKAQIQSGIFSLDNNAPPTPVLIPVSPDPTYDPTPFFNWAGSFDAVTYDFQLDDNSDLSSPVINQSLIVDNSYIPSVPVTNGLYYWHVRAVDDIGNSSGWSSADSFTAQLKGTKPIPTLSYSENPAQAGTLVITATFDQDIVTIPQISIDQPGLIDVSPSNMTGSDRIWTYNYYVYPSDGSNYADGTAVETIANAKNFEGIENGPALNNTFIIDTSKAGLKIINRAEYFIDKDPGEGQGLSIDIPIDGIFDSAKETVEFFADTTELSIGYHTVYLRMCNSDGTWGVARPLANDVYIPAPYNLEVTGIKTIQAAEYFIDSDPGEGNGKSLPAQDGLMDSGIEVMEVGSIDTSNLSKGLHTLYVRAKDSDGKWGGAREYIFEVGEADRITKAEYYVDNSSPIQLIPEDGLFDEGTETASGVIDTTAFTIGPHNLCVRFYNSTGLDNNECTIFSVFDPTGDSDNDGMPNGWEIANGLDPANPADASYDKDSDGLTNLEEYQNNTNPNNPDTDGDGMQDGWEINNGLDPRNPGDTNGDPDNDGLTNIDEYRYQTEPNNPDTDNDGMTDGDEIKYGSDPLIPDSLGLTVQNKNVLVSLQGNNRIIVGIQNAIGRKKEVQISLDGLNASWYTIEEKYRSFELIPFEYKEIYIQLRLPLNCDILIGQYPFTVKADWLTRKKSGEIDRQGTVSDSGMLNVTPNPNVYRLAIPDETVFAGNTIFTAWRTDIPATSYLYYRKLGDTDFIQVPAGTDELEHRVMVPDLEYFTYYEVYTENYSACNGFTGSEIQMTKTGKAVKFVNNVNEFWIDRDYNQQVELTITNTDMIPHNFQLSIANPYDDIVVGFVGDGSNGREATLQPGESTIVQLVINAPDAQKTQYDLYLKMVSDEGEFDSFVDYSYAIVHVRPFVRNLDIQPVQSDPGMMTSRFRLINYGDTLSDIKVYIDEYNRGKTILNPAINYIRLKNGEFIEFDIKSGEYVSGTVYVRSGDYVVSAPFEIGCPSGTSLNTYTINDVGIMAEIKDWYCTNKMHIDLPFAVPTGFDKSDIAEAALEVNFSLPMTRDKYDPHTVKFSINGYEIETMENTIPEGNYIFRFPASFINLGFDGPAQNILSVDVEGIGEGQYIVVTDFKVYLNVNQMSVNLCVPPLIKLPKKLPKPETKIANVEPNKKFRPGDTVNITFELNNNDNPNNEYGGNHSGRLTVLIENNSYNGVISPVPYAWNITVPLGNKKFPQDFKGQVSIENLIYAIPDNADDIEYKIKVTFENITMNSTDAGSSEFRVRTPLIIVHGIMGSKLERIDSSIDRVVWGGLLDFLLARASSVFGSLFDYLEYSFDYLRFYENGTPVYPNIKATRAITKMLKIESIDMAVGVDTFDGLHDELLSQIYIYHPIGDEEDFDIDNLNLSVDYPEDVFYFVYDWRQDNTISAEILKRFIEKITNKQLTGKSNSKVNIVAHSMGGLVVKSLMSNNAFPGINEKINKVIFVGTPHVGAVKAFSGIKYGDNDFQIQEDRYKGITKNLPSGYQLLPSERYFDNGNYPEGFYDIDGKVITYTSNPTFQQDVAKFGNESLFEQAVTFHQLLDDDSYLYEDNTYSIVGCKKPTSTFIQETTDPYSIDYFKGDGDETVPLKSALTVNAHKKYIAQYAEHSNLPSHNGVKRLIRSLLKGYENRLPSGVNEYSPDFCGLDDGIRILLPSFNIGFKIPPVYWPKVSLPTGDFSVYTGNKVYLGILGSDYRITNEGVEIFIPEGSAYTLEFRGVDKEYLDIKFQLMRAGGVIKTYVFSNISLDIEGCGKVVFDLTNIMTDPVLELDYTCDGVTDNTLPPSDILDESQSKDMTAPITAANITGTLGLNDWYVSNVSIDLTATDNASGSGILKTKYRLQDDMGYKDYNGTIEISQPGNYTLTYYSIDRNLNKEIEKVVEFKIDNIPPQITSVKDEGYYSLDKTRLSATVTGQWFSGLKDVCYSAGTAAGSTDIADWTCSGADLDVSIAGLYLPDACSQKYFINIRGTNNAGVQSSIVSSNGITVLEPTVDGDGDGFDNQNETGAGSDPCNNASYPASTNIVLRKGFNLLSFPTETLYYENVYNLMEALGGGSVIDRFLIFNSADKNYAEAGYDGALKFYGTNIMLPAGEGLPGLIVYAKQDSAFTFTSKYCPTWDLRAGTNLVGTPCASANLTAFDLFNSLGGKDYVSSIQRFNTDRGKFETAGHINSQPAGMNFPIKAGEGYFIYMKKDVTGFKP
jgi:hypothetical protein